MRKIWNWIRNNPNRTMFLIPILLVAGISISHVVAWYDMANPINWAIYLSIAIEVGAMTALVAATNKIKGGVWFMFGLVTFIQFVGNIFYSYKEIDPNSESFKMWVELTGPLWDMFTDSTDIPTMKRWLAILEGGLLPIVSLTSLHFFVKYEKKGEPKVTEKQIEEKVEELDWKDELVKEPTNPVNPPSGKVFYVDLENLPTNEEPEIESKSDFNVMEMDVDHSLIEEENPEDEIIETPVMEEESKLRADNYQPDEIIKKYKPTPPPTKIVKEGEEPPHEKKEGGTHGEELSQTWRNIVKRRRGNNGVSRI